MEKIKRIAMIAHDNRKQELIEWVEWNWKILQKHQITCTGTTGRLVEEALKSNMKSKSAKNLNITKLKSGPLGGDQQMGALITEEKIDLIIFLWDPMHAQPHDVDVKALLRITKNTLTGTCRTNDHNAPLCRASPIPVNDMEFCPEWNSARE